MKYLLSLIKKNNCKSKLKVFRSENYYPNFLLAQIYLSVL